MIASAVQRWTRGRASYRPVGEPLATHEYEVAAIPDDTTAKAFVIEHHYSGTFPAAIRRFGLYHRGELVGVAVYSQPWPHVVAAAGLPFPASEVSELSRFVLLDAVPANGETWFLGRAWELLRADGLTAALAFADDLARTDAAGAQVFGGHIGTIYQAHNAVYTGRGRKRTIRLLPDGSVLSDRVQSKIRRRERGWEYGVELLRRHGAPAPGADLEGWFRAWRERLTRAVRHPGCHRYVWAVDRRARRHLPAGRAYPKLRRDAR